MMSNAQLSLESIHASSTLPMQSGRKPSESRTPMISRSLSSTSENAPVTLPQRLDQAADADHGGAAAP